MNHGDHGDHGERIAWASCASAAHGLLVLLASVVAVVSVVHAYAPAREPARADAPARAEQSRTRTRSRIGCMSCHTATDRHTMHQNPGGDPRLHRLPRRRREGRVAQAMQRESAGVRASCCDKAHVLPRDPKAWKWPSSATPERTYTLLNQESPEFVRFINPGDLRVAREACGACHLPIIQASERSLMATSAMLWGGASYNNGILPYKRYILGEAYTRDGEARLARRHPVEARRVPGAARASCRRSRRCPRGRRCPPADIFRVFERGGQVISSQFPEIGLPNSTRRDPEARRAGPARHPAVEPRPRHRAAASRCRCINITRRA